MTRTEVQIISDGYIVTNDLSNGCVTTAKLDDFAITTGKIANQSVTASKLASDIQFFPQGGIIMWSGSEASIPTGWVICNGQNSTPDLRNRFIVGAGSGGNYSVGTLGGADSVTLTENQLPSHNHSITTAGNHSHTASGSSGNAGGHSHTATASTNTAGNHSHSFNFTPVKDGGGICAGRTPSGCHDMSTGGGINAAGDHSHTVSVSISDVAAHSHPISVTITSAGDHTHTIGNTGGGNAHENRPPFYALCFIMKT